MEHMAALLFSVLLLQAAWLIRGFEYGLNAGAQYNTTMVKYVEESGADWVRLNFIVTENQSGPDDPLFHAMYDAIVTAYNNANIKIYGLIGSQSVKSGYDRNNPSSFIEPFTNASVSIISRYRNMNVLTYELFNEPNDWNGGTSSQLPSNYFAQCLESVYLCKLSNNWNDVTLVSGPLFSFDDNSGASYLYDTYLYGIQNYSWESIYSQANTYPLDGIGYHIYSQGGSTDASAIVQAYNYNLNDIWTNGVLAGETIKHSDNNVNGKKFLYVSEFGWGSQDVGETAQSQNLQTAYTQVFEQATNVYTAMWFTLMDFNSGHGWGLRTDTLAPKLAWGTYSNLTKQSK